MRNDSLGLFWEDKPPVKRIRVDKVKREAPLPTWLSPTYLPGMELARAARFNLMTDAELVSACMARERLTFDVECYYNYFLVAFKSLTSGKVLYFEMGEGFTLDVRKLLYVVMNFTLVGFNSMNYDIPIITLALDGKTNAQLKEATRLIIEENVYPSNVLRHFKTKALEKIDHIDLIEVAPLFGSLKTYGGRMHTRTMQDLPFHPEAVLSADQIFITRWYCVNDLAQTEELHNSLTEQMELRESMSKEYGVDLRSRSDAQIAETVISREVQKANGTRPQRPEIPVGTRYKYNIPDFIKFETPLMNWALDIVRNVDFVVGESGGIGLPQELKDLQLAVGGSVYRMGIGGLHSSEKRQAVVADANTLLLDRDVKSYYPFIIINQGLFPKHLGPAFLRVYTAIVKRRLASKGIIRDSLKIVINGSYGKLGSKFSNLYAPDLLIQVTLTGQLSLLMLIERLEMRGISVVSANTDGLVIKCPKAKQEELDAIVAWWERDTNFETEATYYKALYSRDVNNYIAVGVDGKLKTKGAFADSGLSKNPANAICVEAIEKLLTDGVPIYQTIKGCKDLRKFVSVRNVRGGAVKIQDRILPPHVDEADLLLQQGFSEVEGGYWRHHSWNELDITTKADAYERAVAMCPAGEHEYLGRVIRWYYANNMDGEIVYATNGNKVPRSDGACPAMVLPDQFPDNVDFDWYINETESILKGIGYSD